MDTHKHSTIPGEWATVFDNTKRYNQQMLDWFSSVLNLSLDSRDVVEDIEGKVEATDR